MYYYNTLWNACLTQLTHLSFGFTYKLTAKQQIRYKNIITHTRDNRSEQNTKYLRAVPIARILDPDRHFQLLA